MILSTKGIVLHCMDYSETSIIVRVYTEKLGLQSYIAKGARRKGASIRKNLFTPLSVIQVVANHKETEGLRIMREASLAYPGNGIATDMNKMAVSIFMSELLSRSITAQMPDPQLFSLVEEAVMQLEQTGEAVSGFPLWFSIRLAQHLGFGPHNNFSRSKTIFDMVNGRFCEPMPDHPYYFSEPLTAVFSETLTAIDAGVVCLQIDYRQRSQLMANVLDYYRLHVSGFSEIKSVKVLSEVLRD